MHPTTNWVSCLDHGEKLGLGTRDYQLVKDALGNYPAVQGRGAHPLPEPGERVISLRQGMPVTLKIKLDR